MENNEGEGRGEAVQEGAEVRGEEGGRKVRTGSVPAAGHLASWGRPARHTSCHLR